MLLLCDAVTQLLCHLLKGAVCGFPFMEHALVHKDEDRYLGTRLVHMWRFALTWPTMNDIPINLHCCSWCGAIWSNGQAWLGTIDFRCVCIESNERSVVNGISHLLELHRRNSNGIQCKFKLPPPILCKTPTCQIWCLARLQSVSKTWSCHL